MNANGAFQGDCNMHSWSDKGFNVWNSCCYTSDHAEAECMWDKPREITFGSFTGFGYENAAKSGEGDMTPEGKPHDTYVGIHIQRTHDIWRCLNTGR
jgi:hypothetical protein